MINEKKDEIQMCFKYVVCNRCPNNEKCEKELQNSRQIKKKEKEYIHIDISKKYKK